MPQSRRSKRIGPAFYDAKGSRCLTLAVVKGRHDCKYWLADGLDSDIQTLKTMHNKAFKSPVSGTAASWKVNMFDLPDVANQKHTTDFGKVTRTLWYRFMQKISETPAASAVWAKPVRLPFFEDNREYLDSFQRFSLVSKLQIESTISKRGNTCDKEKPVIIKYDRCSENYISLWQEAGRSMHSHVRKKGPIVIPPGAALVWSGLSYEHYMHDSIPAWSMRRRNISQASHPLFACQSLMHARNVGMF
jgi:hypothetical protein